MYFFAREFKTDVKNLCGDDAHSFTSPAPNSAVFMYVYQLVQCVL